MVFRDLKSLEDMRELAGLAEIIWHEHYTKIIGPAQVEYMMAKFQSPEYMLAQLDEGSKYYLAEMAEQPIGYFSFRINDNEGLFLSKLYILAEHRGKGYSKGILKFMEAACQEAQQKRVYLTVNKYNTNSIKAYQKMGFSIQDSVVIDIGGGYVMDDFVMEKILKLN